MARSRSNRLERALELQRRGYLVTPDPSNEANQKAFQDGALKQFERHSRLGFVDEESFAHEVERLRGLGAKRVTLKTGAYPMRELAMALKWSSDVGVDLLTIDGAPGGTGMSPWRMMVEWGIPTVYLEAMTYELCQTLAARGAYIPGLAIGGGISDRGSHLQGAGDGRALRQGRLPGSRDHDPRHGGQEHRRVAQGQGKLPRTVSQFGSSVEEIFVTYETLKAAFRRRGRRAAAGRHRLVHLCGQAARRPAAAHGGQPQFPAGHHRAPGHRCADARGART